VELWSLEVALSTSLRESIRFTDDSGRLIAISFETLRGMEDFLNDLAGGRLTLK